MTTRYWLLLLVPVMADNDSVAVLAPLMLSPGGCLSSVLTCHWWVLLPDPVALTSETSVCFLHKRSGCRVVQKDGGGIGHDQCGRR